MTTGRHSVSARIDGARTRTLSERHFLWTCREGRAGTVQVVQTDRHPFKFHTVRAAVEMRTDTGAEL